MSKISYNFSDNWIDFSYNDARYLDALASLLHVQGDCVAVIKEDDSFYISYNSKNTKLNYKHCNNLTKYTKMILNLFNNGKDGNDVLEMYLSFNVDFIDLVKKKMPHVSEDTREQLEEIKSLHKAFEGRVNLEDRPFLHKYKELIYNKALSKEDFELFLRPLQDSYKLYSVLKEEENLKFNVVDNVNELHAEYNLSKLFDRVDTLDNNYIGISKLSCGYCHNSLEYSHHEHRGTHGVCDNKWKMSSLIPTFGDKFKSSIPAIKEFNQEELPVQYRKLSMDDFESELKVPRDIVIFFQGKTTTAIGYISLEDLKKSEGIYYNSDDTYQEILINGENFSYNTEGYWGID